MVGSVTDEVRQRVDVVELISRYTPLKRAGSVYKGLCPFHSERTPSFVVFPHTGTWHCFGACGTGGDVFSFVMQKENLSFREALQMLAQQVGVDLSAGEQDSGADQRTRLVEANEAAAQYFQHILTHHAGAAGARGYLERRGIDDATAARFRLGYALDGWSGLRDHLLERGFALELLLEAGLIKRNEERQSTYDAFRNRVIYPICDRQGRVIGFGGRVLDDSVPKYLNTAETPLFHKSHVVYGLDQAHRAIRERDQVVIVEGYMDVIAAHQFGYTNVVACMG
ncbi:MAG: DNA primase, partial [Caldilinea sp.]|nr:DNA primase [Caldilinea sp.]